VKAIKTNNLFDFKISLNFIVPTVNNSVQKTNILNL
jgi:hypothetical protein